jgi:hypothetical protein
MKKIKPRRRWTPVSLFAAALILLALGVTGVGRLLVYSVMPFPEDRLALAVHLLAYNGIACPGAYRREGDDFGEATIAVRCRDPAETRYVVSGELPCAQPDCEWFRLLCWSVAKR